MAWTLPRAGWLLHESGLASVWLTGLDAWLIILARACRMFAFGAVSLVMALFLAELRFSDLRIGLFMTLTLVGDVFLNLGLTFVADSVGRRRIFLAGGIAMAASGAVFYLFENYWILLAAAVFGVVSATGGDFGPFRAIEESTLSHLTVPETRADVLSWYVTFSSLGSAVGTEVAGRFVEGLRQRQGWSTLRAYHAMFGIYVAMGVLNVFLTLCMSKRCEIDDVEAVAANEGEAAQGFLELDSQHGDSSDEEDADGNGNGNDRRAAREALAQPQIEPASKKSRFSQISSGTRSVMYKLWFLLTVDSLADGMVSLTLTNYYLDRKFHLSKSTLGDIMSTAYLLGTASTVFAGPLARHLGLLNTMVFTHIPSSAAVLFFPAPQSLAMTVVLLFVRIGLNNMDQAPRAAFIAAVVKPEERTAVMGITSTLRTLASTLGPSCTGALAGTDKFWVAFVIGGSLRLFYDFGLWGMFLNTRLHVHESNV